MVFGVYGSRAWLGLGVWFLFGLGLRVFLV